MQTGFSLNKAKEEFEEALFRTIFPLTPAQAKIIGDALIKVLEAAIPMQSHPGGMRDY